MRDGEYIQSIDVRFLKIFVPVKRLRHPIVHSLQAKRQSRAVHCELCIKKCVINVNLGAAGVAGATYFLFCNIYAREGYPQFLC